MYIECTFLYCTFGAHNSHIIYVQKQALHVVQAFGGPCDSYALSAQFTHAYYTRRWQAAPPFHKDSILTALELQHLTRGIHATNTYDSFGVSPHLQGRIWLANDLSWIIRIMFENWTHIYCPSSSMIFAIAQSFFPNLCLYLMISTLCMTLFSNLWRSDGKSWVSYSGCFSLPQACGYQTLWDFYGFLVNENCLILVGPMYFAR